MVTEFASAVTATVTQEFLLYVQAEDIHPAGRKVRSHCVSLITIFTSFAIKHLTKLLLL